MTASLPTFEIGDVIRANATYHSITGDEITEGAEYRVVKSHR
jgi:hypothetical protein